MFETALAMTRWHRLSAFVSKSPTRLRAAQASNQSSSWTALDAWTGAVPFSSDDPSIAVISASPGSSCFVVFGRVPGSLRYTVYDSESGFGSVQEAFTATSLDIDKPWVVRRSSAEWLVFWWQGSVYKYLRSTTGTEWGAVEDPPVVPVTIEAESPIPAFFCCQPAVGADGTIYLAYVTAPFESGGKIRVLIGTDGTGGLEWNHMRGVGGAIVELPARFSGASALPVACTNGASMISRTVPQIAVDPTLQGVVYIVYHDVAEDDADDMNVYLQRLESTSQGWIQFSTPTRVNNDVDEPGEARRDQFVPSVIVDPESRVHVTFYDNRSGGCPAQPLERYDVYHALSTDGGVSFVNRSLRTDCDQEPPLDAGLHGNGVLFDFSPREYNGIALYHAETTTRVWVTYAGTSSSDPDTTERSVIYGQLLTISE